MKMNNKKFGIVEGGIEAFTVVQNTIWGVSSGSNALIKISMDTWTIEYIAEIPVSIDEKPIYLAMFLGIIISLSLFREVLKKYGLMISKNKNFQQLNLIMMGFLKIQCMLKNTSLRRQ